MRKLLTALAVLLVLLVAADRVAASVAADMIGARLQSTGSLTTEPEVTIAGFPFLTQVAGGRLQRLELVATDVDRRSVRLDRLEVAVLGARFRWQDAVNGRVNAVPVEGLQASAVVRYVDVVSRSQLRRATITPQGDGVRVSARLTVLGQTVSASSLSGVRLERGSLVITARSVEVAGEQSPALNRAVAKLLDLRVPVGTLPYGLQLQGVRVSPEGLVLQARTGPTVLQPR